MGVFQVLADDGAVGYEILLQGTASLHAAEGKSLLECVRKSRGAVFFRAPKIDAEWRLFNKQGIDMDLMREVLANEGAKGATSAKELLVAPRPAEMPDDGMLNYVAVESIFDLKEVPAHSVILVGKDFNPQLKLVAENAPLFGLELRVLVGIGGVEYSMDFDAATWNLERVAYGPFLTDLRLEKDLSAQLAAESATVHDVERSRFERSDGSVKRHDADVRTTKAALAEDDVADEEQS